MGKAADPNNLSRYSRSYAHPCLSYVGHGQDSWCLRKASLAGFLKTWSTQHKWLEHQKNAVPGMIQFIVLGRFGKKKSFYFQKITASIVSPTPNKSKLLLTHKQQKITIKPDKIVKTISGDKKCWNIRFIHFWWQPNKRQPSFERMSSLSISQLWSEEKVWTRLNCNCVVWLIAMH